MNTKTPSIEKTPAGTVGSIPNNVSRRKRPRRQTVFENRTYVVLRRGLGEDGRELRGAQVGGEAAAEPLDPDRLQYLRHRAQHRAGLDGAPAQALPRRPDPAAAAALQAQAQLQLPAGHEGVLPRRALHQLRGHRLERLDTPSERLSRLLLPGLLFHGSVADHEWHASQRRYQGTCAAI